MIRIAAEEDALALIPVASKFYQDTHKSIPFGDTMEDTVYHCINNGIAVISVIDDVIRGVFLGVLMYNEYEQRTDMHELMWQATDGSGRFLLNAALEDAKNKGVHTAFIGIINEAPEVAHALVKRVGFCGVETVYRKEL